MVTDGGGSGGSPRPASRHAGFAPQSVSLHCDLTGPGYLDLMPPDAQISRALMNPLLKPRCAGRFPRATPTVKQEKPSDCDRLSARAICLSREKITFSFKRKETFVTLWCAPDVGRKPRFLCRFCARAPQHWLDERAKSQHQTLAPPSPP